MMGSLPNLHELERIERKKEKRRERKLREEMAKNIKLEKNKLFQLKMVSGEFVCLCDDVFLMNCLVSNSLANSFVFAYFHTFPSH